MTQPVATDVPGLFMLPLPTPFPIGRVNTYLVQDECLTLIDTGINTERSYAALVEGLATLGLRPADLERILITHHHVDHLGQVDRLVAESGAEVWCHPGCVPFLEQPAETRARVNAWSVIAWQEAGAPQDFFETTGPVLALFDSVANGPVRVACQLDEGGVVQLLGRRWDVLHTPGHAGDLICLYQPEEGVLLSSDHLLRDVSSNALIEPPAPGQKRPRRLLDYMAQLQRVAALNPRIAYGGHGAPTTEVAALVEKRLALHEQRARHILALMGDTPVTLYALTERVFPRVNPAEMFLALSEVLGHVDWLEQDGLAERVPSETDVVRWRAVRQG